METSKNTNPQISLILTKPSHHHLEEEEKEDTLSLRDLPLNAENTNSSTITTTSEDHRDSSTELFEFLTSTSYDVSPADNIIFAGKLIPLNYQNAFFSPPEHISPRIRSRSESLSAIHDDKISRDNVGLMRTSRSLNYCKFSRDPTTVHSTPIKTTSKLETASFGSGKSVRPRWYVIMFGMVKFPPEIELKDIKNRQFRRNIPPVKFPSPADRKSRRSRSPSPTWRFLNALSCKQPTSVAATAPFRIHHV